jgi:hypothetical protein
MTKHATLTVCVLLALAGIAQAQSTTTLSVSVGPEAALTVTTGTTNLTTSSTTFGSNFTGTTSLTYQIRTTKSTGTGTLSVKITTDFAGTGGPSVGTPPSSGDTLQYTCGTSAPATPCTGSVTASTASSTNVLGFGAGANSSKAGNSEAVSWALTDDPVYATGTYTATATFTISAT